MSLVPFYQDQIVGSDCCGLVSNKHENQTLKTKKNEDVIAWKMVSWLDNDKIWT